MEKNLKWSKVGLIRAFVVSMVLVASPGLLAQTDSGNQSIDLKALQKDIDAIRSRLTQLRGQVDRAQFDPEAMVDHLNFDAEPILEFVQNTIVFQPYEGVLRGVTGTLQAGAGNSLDQSILLASMLKSAGFDARVVKGTLPDMDALRLLRQTASGTPNASLQYLQPSVEASFPEVTPSTAGRGLRQTQAFRVTQTQGKLLVATLNSAGMKLEPRDIASRWLPVLRAYFWVQYRDAPSDEWQNAHPAFGHAEPPVTLEPEEFFADSIPEKYHQTFRISAFMEQLVSGKIVKHQLMKPWSAPVANLNGQAIRYRNAPNGLNLKSVYDLDKAIADTQFLMPTLNSAEAPGAQAFDLKGRVIDPMAVGSPAAGLFKTLGDKMVGVAEEVADDGGDQPLIALHSMWLEFTFTTPSGESQTQRRYLIAPRTDYSGDEQDLIWPLMTDHVYMLATGGQPLDFLADRYLDTAIKDVDWLQFMLQKAFESDIGVPLPAEPPADFPALTQYWTMDRYPGLEAGVIAYRSRPGLLGLRRGFRDADTAFVGVDIVWNAIEHVRITQTGLEQMPAASLSRGVWDTALEAVPAKVLDLESQAVASTTAVFQLADQQGLAVQVLQPDQMSAVDSLGLNAQAQHFMKRDMAQGYMIIAPAQVPAGVVQAGWWRVRPDTGETLGMTGDGYGQDSVEYILMDTIMTATSLVNAVSALKECERKPSMVTKLCCLVEAHINNVGGLAFGSMLGAAAGTAGAAVFDIMNTVSGGGLMPSANLRCERLPDTAW